ncbi:MAG: hypothetical protein Q8O82_08135 [Pseudorhodobacter sp.]|nr:hypothetical protein [Pseudorhodobacter sp.]
MPDWLVVGLELTLHLPDDLEPGQTPTGPRWIRKAAAILIR